MDSPQGAVLLGAITGCSCVSPLTSLCLEGQSSSACSAEVCSCSGVMDRVHSSSNAVKNGTLSHPAHCLESQLIAIIELYLRCVPE